MRSTRPRRPSGRTTIVVTTGGKLAAQARADGVPVIPLPGGFQSRAAVAYWLVVALEVAGLCGAGERLHAEVDVAAEHASVACGRVGAGLRGGLAGQDAGARCSTARSRRSPAPRLTAPIAYRWKTQINENAKSPAFASELPEMCHNELVGWEDARELGRFSAVFLDDSDLHPRVRQRIELTRGLIASRGGATFRIDSIGQTRT